MASLVNAVKENQVEKDAVIMLNITGGGEELFKKTHSLHYLKPHAVLPMECELPAIKQALNKLDWNIETATKPA